jgi:uncharacterized membrane protein
MQKKIRRHFITGIAVLFPVVITIVVVRFVIMEINKWMLAPIAEMLQPIIPGTYLMLGAKVLIFLLFILCTAFIGWMANILVVRKFFGAWENLFLRIPMMGKIYRAVKQISSAFLGHGKTIFRHVVLFEYPRKGTFSIGFVTGETKGEIRAVTKEETLNVFLPTTPNPTSGYFLVVPKKDAHQLNMTVEEALKLIVSGGAVSPDTAKEMINEKQKD